MVDLTQNEYLLLLRSTHSVASQISLRDLYGQYWKSSEELGYDLQSRLRIGRTTSLDSGVLSEANVIVATAALEVGFNDPNVGATIQHKSPRGFASYLQLWVEQGEREKCDQYL